MRDRRGRFVSFALSLPLAVCMLQPAALAADASNFRDNTDFLQGYYGEERDHTLNVYAASVESEPAGPDQFEVSLEGTELPVLSVASAEGQPTTYYCLADVSGSLNQEQLTQEKDVLLALADGLSEDDRMVVTTVGNEMAASGYLNDKNQLIQIIEEISITPDDTNLYTAIAESIRALDRSGDATRRKCIVVLSDGEDYQRGGQTKEDADRAIQETKIPVYTVALMRQSRANDGKWVEYAKLLGSLARESAGGAHFNPTLDGTDGKSVGEQIAADMRGDLVLTLDVSAYAADKEELKLLVQYSTRGGEIYGDTMTVYRRNLPAPAQSPDEGEDTADTEGGTPEEETPDRMWIWIAAAAVLLVLCAVIFAVSRKKKKEEAPPQEPVEENQEQEAVDAETEEVPDTAAQPEEEAPAPPVVLEERPLPPRVRVLFTAIGYEQIRFQLELEKDRELTIGRDGRANVILNPDDKKLSGVNSRIICGDYSMRVWDAGSTNGTAVNGVPLSGRAGAIVQDGQTLRVGSYEYRVQFIRGDGEIC